MKIVKKRIFEKIRKKYSNVLTFDLMREIVYLSMYFIYNELKEGRPVSIENFGTFSREQVEANSYIYKKRTHEKKRFYLYKFIPHFNFKKLIKKGKLNGRIETKKR